MDDLSRGDDEQERLWNGLAGQAWVEMQEVLDRMFAPIEALLVEAVASGSRERVLDVGCGAGATTLALARRLGPEGDCVGIDLSDLLIATARARAGREGVPAHFIRADAQTCEFEPASFDRIISRFGVMFFGDFVQAFANLRRAARKGGELRFVAWRNAAENPFMTTAERAAAPLLPEMPERRPDAPGQFAFADHSRVRGILEESGWTAIDIQAVDFSCSLPEEALVPYLTRLGPLGRVFHGMNEGTRARVVERVRPAFDPYVQGAEVRFTAACWLVRAQAPAVSAPPSVLILKFR